MATHVKLEQIDEECNSHLQPENRVTIETLKIEQIYVTTGIEQETAHETMTTNKIPQKQPKAKRDFVCNACGKVLSTKQTLLNHTISHTKVSPFMCHTCGHAAVSQAYLDSHVRAKHPLEDLFKGPLPKFKCNECEKVYTTKQALERHHISHTNISRFTCDVCEHAATSQTHLDIHNRRKHTLEKPFKCQICGFACPTTGQLRGHLRTHYDDKRYRCAMCDYSAHTKGPLVRHVKQAHTNDRDWPCPHCSKSFVDKYALKAHIQSHSTEKPLKCHLCHTSFKHTKSLGQHQNKFHSESGRPRARSRK